MPHIIAIAAFAASALALPAASQTRDVASAGEAQNQAKLVERIISQFSGKVLLEDMFGRMAAAANRGRALQESEIDRISASTDEPLAQRLARAMVLFDGPVPSPKGLLVARIGLAVASLHRDIKYPGYFANLLKNAAMTSAARSSVPRYREADEEFEIRLNVAFTREQAAEVVRITDVLDADTDLRDAVVELKTQLENAIARDPQLLGAFEKEQIASERVLSSRALVRHLIDQARQQE